MLQGYTTTPSLINHKVIQPRPRGMGVINPGERLLRAKESHVEPGRRVKRDVVAQAPPLREWEVLICGAAQLVLPRIAFEELVELAGEEAREEYVEV
jgi:hypothetical protein